MKKKLLRIFFAFIMFFSVLPTAHIYNKEETKIEAAYSTTDQKLIFCEPNSDWKQSGAKFAVYLWTEGVSGDQWILMSQVSGQSYYYAAVPNSRNRAILVRMNSSTTSSSLNWNNKWNQTQNLTLDQSNTNYYKITGWDNSCTGSSKSYTITYNKNSGTGTMSNQSISFYSTTLTKNAFTRTGYTFTGWNTKSDGSGDSYTDGQSIGCLTNVTGGTVTLYAQWKVKTYTVTLDKQGGTGGTDSFIATYGAKTSITAPTREGYEFKGYWTGKNGSGTQMYYATGTAYRNWNIDAATTLYAHWEANVCNLKFDLNYDNAPTNPDSVDVTYDQVMNLPVPERTGYTFLGWNTGEAGGGTYYQNGEICKITAGSDTLYAIWQANSYSIIYNSNSGSGTMNPTSINYDKSTTLTKNTFTKTGYSFNNWNTKADGTGDSYTDGQTVSNLTSINGDSINLYAQWKANEYSITFNVNGGDSSHEAIGVVYDAPYGTLPTPTHSDSSYIFTGWFTAASGGNEITADSIVKITSNSTLYAQWKQLTKYNLTLDPNGVGAQVNPTTIQFYETLKYGYISSLPTPIRHGYIFAGWYSAATGGTKVDDNSTVLENTDHTLYAHWVTQEYSLTYDLAGGEVTASNPDSYHIESDNITLNNPTKTGYDFTGWTEQISINIWHPGFVDYNTGVYGTNSSYPNAYYSEPFFVKAGVTYTISGSLGNLRWRLFDTSGTYIKDSPAPGDYSYTPVQDGYVTLLLLNGATEVNRNAAKITSSVVTDNLVIPTGSNSNRHYIANWEAKSYTVSFDENGGSTQDDITVTYDSTYGELPISTRTGYTFDGWFTELDGGTEVDSSTKVQITANQTLYAHWTPQQYTINFNLNYDGAPSNPASVKVTYDSTYSNLPAPTRTGYTFVGWNNGSAGGGQIWFRNGEKVTITKGYTAYAIWELNTYTITLDLDGGSVPNVPTTYTILSDTFNLPSASKDGWTFEGWYDGKTLYKTVTITKGSTGNKTYTAIWTQKITIYADMTEALKQNSSYKNPTIYYWNATGNNSWPGQTMTKIEGNEYKLEIVFASSNTTVYPKSKLTSITGLIFVFYQGNELKQTTNFDLTTPLTTADNGKEYRFTIPQPNYAEAHNWKIDNITFGQIITLKYVDMDGVTVLDTYEITTNDIIDHNFYEKEGYRLEGWYEDPSFTGERHQNRQTTDTSLTLYAKYVEAEDFYLYIDAREVINASDATTNWTPTHVYLWSDYFVNHNNGVWPGDNNADTVISLGNGMYQIKVDASKSYDHLILNNGGTKKTEDINLSPSNVYYIINEEYEYLEFDKQYRFTTTVEENLENLMGVQKVGNTNNFRFSAGLPTGLNIDNNISKNFGYKFIFIKEDNTSYIGYWSFSTSNRLDALRLDELYKSKALDQESAYDGFYALTLKSSASFDYKDYVRVVVVACYKENNSNNTNVIKAQEYIINVDGDNVTLSQVRR